MSKSSLQQRPLRTGVLILCSSVGALVLITMLGLTLLPLLATAGLMLVWLVLSLVLGWVGIEILAALERWLEQDPRFQR